MICVIVAFAVVCVIVSYATCRAAAVSRDYRDGRDGRNGGT